MRLYADNNTYDGPDVPGVPATTSLLIEGQHYDIFKGVNYADNQWAITIRTKTEIGYRALSGIQIVAVPEPSLGLLLGISLIGLVGVGAVRKIKQRKVANS